VRVETGLGTIPVQLAPENEGVTSGRMEQRIPSWRPYERAPELLAALGVEASVLPIEAYPNGPLHVYVGLESEGAVAQLAPDMRALPQLNDVAANCFAGSGRHWKTRMFAPPLAAGEDPATGSAAGPLAIHLARHGRIAFGDEIEIRQGAEIGRPSVLYALADGSAERIERVEVAGSAVIVAPRRISIDPAEAEARRKHRHTQRTAENAAELALSCWQPAPPNLKNWFGTQTIWQVASCRTRPSSRYFLKSESRFTIL
jgi:trans-2,3-dihydro-3-hydroxyanthranilate isomerase